MPTVGKTLLGVLWAGVLWLGNTAWELYQQVKVLNAAVATQIETNDVLLERLEQLDAKLIAADQKTVDLLVATKVIEGKLPFFLRLTKDEFDTTKNALLAAGSMPMPVAAPPGPELNRVRNVLTNPLPAVSPMAVPPAP